MQSNNTENVCVCSRVLFFFSLFFEPYISYYVIVMVYIPFKQYTRQPSCLRRRCNTLIVVVESLVVLLPLKSVVVDKFSLKRPLPLPFPLSFIPTALFVVSLYNTNKLLLYALWIRCFKSRHLIVDVTSILPDAKRFNIRLGIEKLTAERMWPSWNSFELRQSSTISDLLSDRNSVCNHSLVTVSTSYSGIFDSNCKIFSLDIFCHQKLLFCINVSIFNVFIYLFLRICCLVGLQTLSYASISFYVYNAGWLTVDVKL